MNEKGVRVWWDYFLYLINKPLFSNNVAYHIISVDIMRYSFGYRPTLK